MSVGAVVRKLRMVEEWRKTKIVCFDKEITEPKITTLKIDLGLCPGKDSFCILKINNGRMWIKTELYRQRLQEQKKPAENVIWFRVLVKMPVYRKLISVDKCLKRNKR